jgi:hypothetical protein
MAMSAHSPELISVPSSPLSNSALAQMNDEDLRVDLEQTSRAREALSGRAAQLVGEIARRQAFRAVGAHSMQNYLVGQLGVSNATARALDHVGDRLFDLPQLQASLSGGRVSFDKVRLIADEADPESDAEWVKSAESLTITELAELARRSEAARQSKRKAREPEYPTLRRNDNVLSLTARLPRVDYAEVCARIEAQADLLGSDGETPYDQRMAEALLSLLREERSGNGISPAGKTQSRKGSPYLVVAHVPLMAILSGSDGQGQGDGAVLGAELERAGLISLEVARRLACDGALVVALQDEAGHTMYEGRTRRFPTDAQRRELWCRDRHCRFPGCTNVHFVQAHHVVPWKPNGQTDLENLALLCRYHHHEVHSSAWTLSGNANELLTFVGPDNRVMTSSPSVFWGSIGADAERSGTAIRDG